MAVGISATIVNRILDYVRGGGAPASISGNWVQLHTGNPGTVGTANVSSVTTRPSVTFGAASGGVIALSNTPTWSSWAGTNGEIVTHISVWDASSAGNFVESFALTASKTVNTGDTLQINSCSVTVTTAS